MKTNIDSKSALVGLGIGIGSVLAIGATLALPASVGRYQLSGSAAHGMVIDTVTGQVWTKFLSQNGGNSDDDFLRPKLPEKK